MIKVRNINKFLPILVLTWAVLIGTIVRAAIGDSPSHGLVGHWSFDEGSGTSANDSSGNGNNATLVNNPAWTTGVAGGALQFSAPGTSSNNYVSFPSSLQNSGFPTSGTLSFWVNAGDLASQDSKCIFDCWSSKDHLFVRTRNGALQVVLQDSASGYLNSLGTSKYTNSSITTNNSLVPITANQWTHIAVAWDTLNDLAYVYRDGVLAYSFYFGTTHSSWTPSAQVFRLNDPSATFSGLVDDVALYNRSLSPEEIVAIQAGSSPTAADTSAPGAPASLAASSLSPSAVVLGWNPATDNKTVAGYIVYRNGTAIGQVSPAKLSFTDKGLAVNTSYNYEVYAYDPSGNRSSAATVSGSTTVAKILNKTDFEVDNTSPAAAIGGWNQWGPNDQAVTASTELARAGSKSMKADFNFGDWNATDTNNHQRAEITESMRTEFKLGSTYWTGFSQYIPNTWQNDYATNSELIWQFHGADNGPGANSPPLALYIRGDNQEIDVRGSDPAITYSGSPSPQPLVTMPIDPDKGKWVDWVIQVKFDYSNGLIKAWKNGTQVVDYSGSTIYHTTTETNQNGPYVHFGVYKWYWGTNATQVSNRTVYTDEIRIGDNTASCLDVKPTGSNPCPDTTPPTVSIIAPPNASAVSGVVTVSANAADDTSISKVEFYANNALIGNSNSAPYSIQWDTSSFAHNTSHNLYAKAYDSSNNSASSSTITVNVLDITPPAVNLTYPANNARVSRNSTVTISATASDVSAISKVEFYVNGVLKCTDVVSAYSCPWRVPAGKNVTYTLRAKAYDQAGNTNTATSTVVSQ